MAILYILNNLRHIQSFQHTHLLATSLARSFSGRLVPLGDKQQSENTNVDSLESKDAMVSDIEEGSPDGDFHSGSHAEEGDSNKGHVLGNVDDEMEQHDLDPVNEESYGLKVLFKDELQAETGESSLELGQRGGEVDHVQANHNLPTHVLTWAQNNPISTIGLGLGVAAIAVPGVFAAPILGLIGFGSGGVVGGSIAAAIHSSIGSITGGSAFAILQSAGAGGAGAAIVNGVVQGAAVTAVSARGIRGLLRRGRSIT